jgi:hypothetical protein
MGEAVVVVDHVDRLAGTREAFYKWANPLSQGPPPHPRSPLWM